MNIFKLWGEIEINRQKAEIDIKSVEQQAEKSGKKMESSFELVTKEVGKTSNELGELGKKFEDVGKRATKTGGKITKALTVPLLALGGLAGKAAIGFESAFAGVRKTVDATEAEFAALEAGIRSMAKEIPASANEIAGVAEAAGQLDIANEYILEFSRTMIDLGEATNMTSGQAATDLARLANITQMPQTEFDRLGSTVVALGNSLATTEAEIVSMGLGLAGAGKQVGMTEAEILSLAGALSSVGIEAQAGGSAFSRVMVNMQLATEVGGESLDNFARVAGMSAEGFRKAFQDDASGALVRFITGLQNAEKQGVSAIKVLDDMGITEVRMRDALLRAAGAGNLFTESIKLGTRAWEENTALTEEAEQRYATTASKLEIMRNKLYDVGITFGEILLPPLIVVIEKVGNFADWLNALNPSMQRTIVIVGGLVALIGPTIGLIGKLSTGVGALIKAFTVLSTFVKSTLIPAIASISWPVVAVVAGIAALAAVAYEVYRAWDEVKTALVATWDLLKAHATQLGLSISIAMEEMKRVTLSAVNAILERLSVLEKLPFGLGEQFAGLKDSVADSVDSSVQKLAELRRASEQNAERIAESADKTKVAFSDLGSKVAEDIQSVIDAITGKQTHEEIVDADIEGELSRILAQIEDFEYDYTNAVSWGEEERTEIVSEEAQKQADERAFFEQLWNGKLFDLTAERLEKLEAEYKEALAIAEELGADKTAIEEWYAISRTQIIEEEEQRKTEIARKEQEKRNEEARRALERIEQIENDYRRKLFEQSADYIDILQREKQEQIAIALEAGADWLLIDRYYNNLIAQGRQKRADELARIAQDEADELARIKKAEADAELAEQKRLEGERNRFVADYHRRLFEQSADRIDILQREKQEQIAIAQELGADWFLVDTYYNNLIAEERQKRADEILKIAEQEAEAERLIQERKAEEIARIEADWHKKLFEQSADRIDILQREKQEQIQIAIDAGADWLRIDEYYNNEIIKERERRAAELARIAEKEAQDALEAQEKIQQARLSFEQSWADKAAKLDTSPEARLQQLEVERERVLADAEKLNADIAAVNAYYTEQRARIELEIAEGQKSWWEQKMDELDPPLERLKSAVWDAGKTLFEFGKAIASGNWVDAILSVIMETESFGKAMELLGSVLDPIINLLDNVLRPVIETFAKVWEAVINVLASIPIIGKLFRNSKKGKEMQEEWEERLWRERATELEILERQKQEELAQARKHGLDTKAILEYYSLKEQEVLKQNRSSSGGRQISEITGPTRDLLTDLMAPLANFGQIVAPIQDIRNILYERLPNFGNMDFAGAGVGAMGPAVVIENLNVTAPTTGVDDISRATIDQIEKALAGRINFGIRGRGGR